MAEPPAPIAPGDPTLLASMSTHKHGAYYRGTGVFIIKNKLKFKKKGKETEREADWGAAVSLESHRYY